MPRIPLVSEANMTEAQRRVYDAMMNGPRRSPPAGAPQPLPSLPAHGLKG
jgi:hypothetical protein